MEKEHDIFERGEDESETVPRHRDINEITAKGILRKWGIKQIPIEFCQDV